MDTFSVNLSLLVMVLPLSIVPYATVCHRDCVTVGLLYMHMINLPLNY